MREEWNSFIVSVTAYTMVLEGNIPVNEEERKKLGRHKNCLRELVKKRLRIEKKTYDSRRQIPRSSHSNNCKLYWWTVFWRIMDTRTFNRLTTSKDKVLTSIKCEFQSISVELYLLNFI